MTLAKCGAIEDALQLSQSLPQRTVFSWTALISACADCGRPLQALALHQSMLHDGVEANAFTYASLFKACGSIPDLVQGKKFHDDARKKGFTSHAFVANTIVSMYGKCGAFAEAEDMFCSLPQQDSVSWNAMLSAHVEQGEAKRALLSYRQMQAEAVSTDELTFVIALQACGILSEEADNVVLNRKSIKAAAFEIGHALHKDAYDSGYASDTLIGNTLVSMYGKCGAISEAEGVFSSLCTRSVVSWNAMLSQYTKQGQAKRALLLYREMQVHGMNPNNLTFVSVLQACGILATMEGLTKTKLAEIGRALQIDAERNGCIFDIRVRNTLLSMYGKCGALMEAEEFFRALPHHDVVSWNVMLSVYIDQDKDEKAFLLYQQMAKEGVSLDGVTFSCTLQACSALGSLELCNQVHFDVVSSGYDLVTSVSTPLLHAYANCASMVDAQTVWNELFTPDIMSWTTCIAGYAVEGSALTSLHMFTNMVLEGHGPDALSLASVLSACTRSGLVAEGLGLYELTICDFRVTPDPKHLDSMIDLLARAGDFKKVESMLGRMSMHASLTSWLHLLGACRVHGNVELAKHAFDYAVDLQPNNLIPYVLMSTIYAASE